MKNSNKPYWKYDNPSKACAYPRHKNGDTIDYCWSLAAAIDEKKVDNFDKKSLKHWMFKEKYSDLNVKGHCKCCDYFWPWHKRIVAKIISIFGLHVSSDFGLYYNGKSIKDTNGRLFKPAIFVKPNWLRWIFASKGTRLNNKLCKKEYKKECEEVAKI